MIRKSIMKVFVGMVCFGFGVLALAQLIVLGFATASVAGTIQTIFNNVEQGPNSHSSPSIVVNGKKKEELVSEKDASSTLDDAPKKEESKDQPVEQSVAKADRFQPESAQGRKPWLIGLSVSSLSANSQTIYPVNSYGSQSLIGGMARLGYFPLREVGLVGLIGSAGDVMGPFGGAELELVPISLTVFGVKDMLDLKADIGANSFGYQNFSSAEVHGGARLALNFGDRYAIEGGVRTNLTRRNVMPYSIVDAGLTVRF